MNRHLKFRVWNKKSKKYLGCRSLDNTVALTPDGQHLILYQDNEYWDRPTARIVKIEPDYVVEMHTRTQDKNGVDIYEGDIVKYPIYHVFEDPEMFTEQVVWFNGEFQLKRTNFSKDGISFESYASSVSEVVGNIHENPELLNTPKTAQ